MGCGEVSLLLSVVIVDIHGGNVEPGIGEVVQIVLCIFPVYHQTVAGGKTLVECALHEEIFIPLPVLVPELTRFFSYGSSGVASFGIVVVDLAFPFSVIDFTEKGKFGSQHFHIAIFAHLCCVVTIFFGVREFVFT